MALYKFFSCNVEVQYRGYFLSKAMLFTMVTTLLTLILPFFVAYRGRGFWLKSATFYEQPSVHTTYKYLVLLETDLPNQPILCTDVVDETSVGAENCAEVLFQENKCENNNDLICYLSFRSTVNIPPDRRVMFAIMFLEFDYQINTICPLHMQSLAILNKEFSNTPSKWEYNGDIQFYQRNSLPCHKYTVDDRFNISMWNVAAGENVVDTMLSHYYKRDVTTLVKTISSRNKGGFTGTLDLDIHLKFPEVKVRYTPSLMQELKWAWPQYLSLVVIFHWVFNRIKRFVFNNRLLMAWETVPWKRRN